VAFLNKQFPGRRFSTVGELHTLKAVQAALALVLISRALRLLDARVVEIEVVNESPQEQEKVQTETG